ncbi:MAG: hypothetical protein HDR79_07035 [Bacteroides sp.]|nr:hypothetical protein [Bacteroides sp.]MBD5364686.1 hypothetical protein [Bacteroides sp.]
METTPPDPRRIFSAKYDEPLHHVAALLSASVVTLDIPARHLYPLADAGVKTVADLLRIYRSGLGQIKRIGKTAAADIERILIRADLVGIASS